MKTEVVLEIAYSAAVLAPIGAGRLHIPFEETST